MAGSGDVASPDELVQGLAGPEPDHGVDGDPRRRQQPHVRAGQQRAVAVEPHRRRTVGDRRRGRELEHEEPVDQPRSRVQERVEEEGAAPDQLVHRTGGDQADAQPGQRGELEPCDDATPQRLVLGRGPCDVAEDGRHAGSAGSTLEQAGHSEQRDAGRQARQDHRDSAEAGAELHHGTLSEAVRDDAEGRRQEQLRHEERRRKATDDHGIDGVAAVTRQLRQVVHQERPGEARAEPQRERSEQHGNEGAIHDGKGTQCRPGPGRARARPTTCPDPSCETVG